jgi:hypothetical protein
MVNNPTKPGARKGSGHAAPWLETHVGPTDLRLYWIAEQLRSSTTKADRLNLADALEQLSVELTRSTPIKGRRGRKAKFNTWRSVALVHALMKRDGAEQGDAIRAVVGNDPKDFARVDRYMRKQRSGKGPHFLSFNEDVYDIVRRRLPKIHRIK